MMSKVSVIIPVYNAATYLDRCVGSFLGQSLSDYELILVDDGSTDASRVMCDDYARQYNNVFVIHQTNQGVSAARQTGLNSAGGKYFIFADPDDWVEPKMLEELVYKADVSDADVLICDFFVDARKTIINYESQLPSNLSPKSVLRQILVGELHGSTCNKLYRMETIRKYDISFPNNINFCEDLWFNCRLLMHDEIRVGYLGKAFYHYDFYTNSTGLSRKFSSKSLQDYRSFTGFIFKNLEVKSETESEISFFLKKQTKRIAFRSDCKSEDYRRIYPDLRDAFISDIKSSNLHWTQKIGELLALRGFLGLGRRILWYYEHMCVPLIRLLKGI